MPDTIDPDVYALAMLDALAEGDDDTAAALLDEAGGGGDGDDDPTPDDQPDDTPDTSLKALSLPPRVLAAVRLHQEADDAGRAELVRLAAEDGEAYERLVDDEVAAGGVFVTKAEWHEEQHPRDHGKFSEKEGAAREPDHIDRRKPRFTGETHYHGSPDEIDQFDDRPTSFATNENHANTFGPNLHAVKLDVRNPVDLSALGSGAGKDSPESERVTAAQLHEALAEYGIDIDFGQPRSGWTSDLLRPHLPEIFRQGRALGYDGLKLGDFKDFEADEVMPFSPKQVKLVARNGEAVGKKTKPAGDKNQFAKLMGDAVGNNFMRTMDELFGAALKGKYGPEVQEHAKKVSDWGSQKFAKLLAEVGGDDGDGTTDAPDTTDADLLKSLPPRVAAAVRLHQQADDAGRAELVRLAADDPEGYERLIDDAVAEMLG